MAQRYLCYVDELLYCTVLYVVVCITNLTYNVQYLPVFCISFLPVLQLWKMLSACCLGPDRLLYYREKVYLIYAN